jgi:septal ring factor EnvC (AmiA/AmiB activator)
MNNEKKGFIFRIAFVVFIAAASFAIGGISFHGSLSAFIGDRGTANELAKQLDSSGERIRELEDRLARSEQDSVELRNRLGRIDEASGNIERGIISGLERSGETVDTVEKLRTILQALEKTFNDFGAIHNLTSGGPGLYDSEVEGGEQ